MNNFFKKHFIMVVLVVIVLTGAFLRFYQLDKFPVGFHIDEASLGYNAYSLLLTGKDDNNNTYPFYIDIFGDNRPSGYHYLTILPVKIFGLTEFSTRFSSAFFGILMVAVFYFFASAFFNDYKIGLLSSLFIAVSPWHIILSRASSETIVALFMIILGFLFVIKSLQNNSLKYLILGTFFSSISFFFYHTPRVFVPFFFILLIFFFFSVLKRQKNNNYKIAIICSCTYLLVVALTLVFFIKGGTGRFNQVNIFSHPEVKLVLEEQIREDGVAKSKVLETRFFHNKLINYSLAFVSNYLEYFSPEFLFIKGGLPIWYKVYGIGLIYLVELPFLLLGLAYLVVHKQPIYKLPLLWLLSAPLTASLTVDDIPNIQRVIVMFPIIELITAYGLVTFLRSKPYRTRMVMSLFISIFLFLNILYFLHQYFVNTGVHRTWYRNNGASKMMSEIKKVYNKYDKVIISKSVINYPLVLFYAKYDPKAYLLEGSPKDKEYSGFGKFFFVPQGCPSYERNNRFPKVDRAIYINHGTCKDNKSFTYQDIYREDGTKAFSIVYE